MKQLKEQWWRILVVLIIGVIFWLPRGFGLERYATADENAWLTRSANFYRALARGDWGDTFQRHHPGVTLTWAGTLGFLTTYPAYRTDADRDFGWLAEELPPFLREHGQDPAELLAAGRGFAVLFIVLALTLSFLFAWRAWGLWPALAGSLLLAFDPFQIAHSRLMHLDGLLSSFMILAVVALFVALDQSEDRRWQRGARITAGIATGLAWLTRSPGLFLLPFAGLLGLVFWLRYWRRTPLQGGNLRATTWFLLVSLGIWAAIAAATFYLLWPAMWVDPLGSLREVLSAANAYAEEGHADPIFFNGMIYNGDPGFWFYPITFLWRTTPLVLVGLVLALVRYSVLAFSARSGATKNPLPASPASRGGDMRSLPRVPSGRGEGRGGVAVVLLIAFALCFVLFMNLGAKKFDRYLLPVYPALDLVAGMGFVAVTGWVWRRWQQRTVQIAIVLLAVLLIASQGALALPHYPYYLTYYNPLLGGGQAATAVMQIGRGEGADLAAQFLNQQTPVSTTQVPTTASSFPNGPFSYFFQGRTLPPTYWPLADYAVLYTQDVQRQMPSARQVGWLESLPPMAQIDLHGIEYARIYALADAPPPAFVTAWAQGDEAQIRLNSYELTAGVVQPGEAVHTTLYLENLAPINDNLNLLVRLVGADGSELVREEGWPWGAETSTWQVGDIWPDGHTLLIPPTTPPGYYRLEVGFYEPTTQAVLQATQPSSGNALPEMVPVDYLQVGMVPQEPMVPFDEPYQLGDSATLLGYTTETSTGRQIDIRRVPLLPGEDLHLTLFWQAQGNSATDYSVFVHVLDSNGAMLTQQDGQPVQGFLPTSLWHKGQIIADTHTLTIPAGAALGEYPIQVGLYDLATGTRLPIRQGATTLGDTIPLTRLVIALSRMEDRPSTD